jgi:hypothetical protein
MTSDDRKAWDQRLVEWMQRRSNTAKSTAWTPRTRAIYATVFVILAIVYGGAFNYAVAGLLVVTSLVLGLGELRQRH